MDLFFDRLSIENKYYLIEILGVVKRNPLFLHEIKWKNNGFLLIPMSIFIKLQ